MSAFQPKPFPIPVISALGPGSQDEDEHLQYLTLPRGMDTYQSPVLPEPEDVAGRHEARRVLRAVRQALAAAVEGAAPPSIPLSGMAEADLALINQVLGEGEVSAQVLAEAGRPHARIQESVFAGVWRVIEVADDGEVRDRIEVAPVPALLREAARDDAAQPRPPAPAAPPTVMNAPAILSELDDQRRRWREDQPAHVVNLTLLPLGPDDIGYLDHVLGTGRVLILSRGYGNCRITNARVPNTWRVVYYNSQDAVILNAIEVTGLPEVACAAHEDLQDSLERLTEVLAWVEQD